MSADEVRRYRGLNPNDPELVTTLKKIRYDLTDLQVKVSEALRMAGALSLDPPVDFICPQCRLRFRSIRKCDEHIYVSHDGPLPAHWAEAEAAAGAA